MFSCYLCPSDEWTTTGLCSVCHDIKQFVENSSSTRVLVILQKEAELSAIIKKEDLAEISNDDIIDDECPTRELNLRSGKKKCYSSVCREGKKYNV